MTRGMAYVPRTRATLARKRASRFLAGTAGTAGTPRSRSSILPIGLHLGGISVPPSNHTTRDSRDRYPPLRRSRPSRDHEKEDRSPLACDIWGAISR